MKVNVPQRYDSILLGDFVRYHSLKTDVDRVMLITGMSRKTIESWQASTIDTIVNEYASALENGTPRLDYVVKGDTDLGFIPDIDAISLREHIDLDTFAQAIWKDKEQLDYTHLPQLMAILYRPIKTRFGTHYELEQYDVDRVKYYLDAVNRLTMSQVHGVMVFFSTILSELVQNSVHFLEEEKAMMIRQLEAMT
jgi:hypothetical protein